MMGCGCSCGAVMVVCYVFLSVCGVTLFQCLYVVLLI